VSQIKKITIFLLQVDLEEIIPMQAQAPQKISPSGQISTLPLVSIILNNYNYGRFLKTAVESVLNQTYTKFELIVVDDGSTDESQDVIESYGDRIIPIFQKNAGQAAAVQAGFQRAQGEIVCLLDADDYFHPEKLAKVVAAFENHPEWVQLSHCWTSVNAAGLKVGTSASDRLSQGDVTPLLLRWGRYASGISSTLAFRRSILDQVMPAPDCVIAIDSYLNMTVPFYGAVGCLNESLMFYRIHGKNRRARCVNIDYLIHQRQKMAGYLNQAAAQQGQQQRFDLQNDVDYRTYIAVEQGHLPFGEALSLIWLSLQESWEIGRSPKDTCIRLLTRSICALWPREGLSVLRYGLRGYVRYKLSGQEPVV
jgi:glycosyltransferase involved in cell wall biosynthesis